MHSEETNQLFSFTTFNEISCENFCKLEMNQFRNKYIQYIRKMNVKFVEFRLFEMLKNPKRRKPKSSWNSLI